MKTIEAYEFTLKKIEELLSTGIEITKRKSKSINDQEVINKYSGSERIPPEKWLHISFKINDKFQSIKIHEAANYLGMCGIRFDTGGCSNCRDWELDWSFRYTGKEDEDWRDARDEVENIISNEL